MKKQNYIAKSVLDMTTNTTYESLTEAAKALNAHVSTVSLTVNGKQKTCKGHELRFAHKDTKKAHSRSKPVIDITTGITYASAAEAAKAFGVHHSAIGYAANGKIKTVKKHVFRFVNDLPSENHLPTTKKIYAIHKGKSTLCLTTGEIYKSAIEAAHMNNLKYSAVIDSCRKGSKCADSGLTFCYLEDAPYRVMDIVAGVRMNRFSKELTELKDKHTTLLNQKEELDAKQAEVLKELEAVTKEINDLESKLN